MTDVVAAVDLGSNSFHMIIGRVVDGEFRTLERVKERVQLAAGLDARSELTVESRARALACLRRFAQRLRGVSKVRAVGTSALREAANRRAFLDPAEAILGCPIDVISGEDEGRLIYTGIAGVLADDAESRLVVDIGGGSTELVAGRRGVPDSIASVPIGCVSVTRRFLHAPAHLGHAYSAAQARVQARIESVRESWPAGSWRHIVGSSGTIESAQEMLRLNGWTIDIVTREAVERLHEHLARSRTMLDAALSGLAPDRVDIFPGGFAILAAVFRAFDLQQLEYVDASLLDGVLYELLDVRDVQDVRGRTIVAMQRRYQVDTEQARRVGELAEALRRDVASAWRLDQDSHAQLLGWAAALHEIGLAVAPINHPRHGAYLIDHGEMRGFNTPQRRAIALLVRSQRRIFQRAGFSGYPPAERQRMTRLAFLLRLAILLCGARTDRSRPAARLVAEGDEVRLWLPPDWLREHALSAEILLDERSRLAALGVRFEFADG